MNSTDAYSLLLPFLSYVFVTTFTPGPNNLASAALAMRLGYARSLPFMLGIAAGFFTLMFVSGLLTDVLTLYYSSIAPWLKWIGVAYIIWLTASLFAHGAASERERRGGSGFASGLLLQLFNVKVILYGITLYASFSALIAGSLPRVALSSVLLTLLGFASISLWALLGAGLSKLFRSGAFRLFFNLVMAGLLLYSAWAIAAH